MSSNRTPPPMLARAAGPSTVAPRTAPASDGVLVPRTTPEEVLGRLRQLIEEGNVTAARRLSEEAKRRFPDHSRVALAQRVLAPPRVRSTELAQPTVEGEREWLANPPAEALGKWVALVGSEVVGMADSLEELEEIVRASQLEQIPVVQHLAP